MLILHSKAELHGKTDKYNSASRFVTYSI